MTLFAWKPINTASPPRTMAGHLDRRPNSPPQLSAIRLRLPASAALTLHATSPPPGLPTDLTYDAAIAALMEDLPTLPSSDDEETLCRHSRTPLSPPPSLQLRVGVPSPPPLPSTAPRPLTLLPRWLSGARRHSRRPPQLSRAGRICTL
ncbi:hypothetical protein VC83_03260 [Pseudogymnoascus destructans]|uniref:Uncharacterized protein n=1 Tax=Pseudogymnoascus destructans TaxID=655981 RepID=A0A177AE50_9PEZI|nr:uncharacterized protein VC83_03260 [Pseudogymnoascus destructans]OAF60385.1 hypothetical protein VC83_03260 [Pseudogymnoascus destructans]